MISSFSNPQTLLEQQYSCLYIEWGLHRKGKTSSFSFAWTVSLKFCTSSFCLFPLSENVLQNTPVPKVSKTSLTYSMKCPSKCAPSTMIACNGLWFHVAWAIGIARVLLKAGDITQGSVGTRRDEARSLGITDFTMPKSLLTTTVRCIENEFRLQDNSFRRYHSFICEYLRLPVRI